MFSHFNEFKKDRITGLLVVVFFFILLGDRSLNEPDEGRYGEIAREMVETGNWLVPHIWYVPHLDKPPMTYWLVAVSIKIFGLNEFAVRLPLALAGMSGVLMVFLLGREFGGQRSGRWAALVLSSSLLYWAMSRMLTTDIFMTQFIAWSLYCFWRSWRALDGLDAEDEEKRAGCGKCFFMWQLGMWISLGLGFLTKGPIPPVIVAVTALGLLVFRKSKLRWQFVTLAMVAGLPIFCTVALPWFFMVFAAEESAFDFMVKGQVVGHAMGGHAKGRSAPFFYFFGILAGGFAPWTPLLGWFWRKRFWKDMSRLDRERIVFLGVWALFTFIMFSVNSSKLPAYILPMFPPLAVFVGWRFFGKDKVSIPQPVWRAVAGFPLLILMALPIVYFFAFKISDQNWFWWQCGLGAVALVVFSYLSRKWSSSNLALSAVALQLVQLTVMLAFIPTIETRLRSNQTLREVGEKMKEIYQEGDVVVCWGRFPQGLPMYAYPVINRDKRPYLAMMPQYRLPFEYPGNAPRLVGIGITNAADYTKLLEGDQRVLGVGWAGATDVASATATNVTIYSVLKSGHWELFSNQKPFEKQEVE
ncbi:glycosyltransferase family 39 protein [Verrucomicrobia bacterium]|nr:glycosyltransferase family 39 protein [Verrucomicrobiota bacterium]